MYDFVDVTVDDLQKVYDAIQRHEGHATLSLLAEMSVIYAGWQLLSHGALALTFREDAPRGSERYGWGFTLA